MLPYAGMGFIQSNHSVIMYNNTMISFNMMEVSRIEGIKRCAPLFGYVYLTRCCPGSHFDLAPWDLCRFFYASSACIYPENKQLDTEIEGGGLKEKDAWPAQVRSAVVEGPCALPAAHFAASRSYGCFGCLGLRSRMACLQVALY